MPITYTYRCSSCEHKFEIEQSIKDNALSTCPVCKEDTLNRVVQPNPFLLKGEGWPGAASKSKWHL